jgi:hypothetical protein
VIEIGLQDGKWLLPVGDGQSLEGLDKAYEIIASSQRIQPIEFCRGCEHKNSSPLGERKKSCLFKSIVIYSSYSMDISEL